MKFARNLFPNVEPSTLPFLEYIERIHTTLSKLPHRAVIGFAPDDEFEIALKSSDLDTVALSIVNDVYCRFQFFWYSSAFKLIQLCEALCSAYNSRNFLSWTLLARSVVEHAAIISYFSGKFERLNPTATSFVTSQIRELEKHLIQYSHGTRFNWQSLLKGNLAELLKNLQATGESPPAINVLTAIQHLAKQNEQFHDVEAVYGMLSDFAHPNMGSHSLVMDVPETSQVATEAKCTVAVSPNNKRGEFLMVATLPAIKLCMAKIMDVLSNAGRIAEHWGHLANRELAFDIGNDTDTE